MKILCLYTVASLLFLHSSLNAQDSLFMSDGQKLPVKVLEIETAQLKYKKFSNLDGPTYTIEKSKISKIKYLNGEEEIFNAITAVPKPIDNNNSIDLISLTGRGKNVFIKNELDELHGLTSEVRNLVNNWNYWNIVFKEEDADFILQVTTLKKGMTFWTNTSVSSKALIISKSGSILWESEYFKSITSMYNGYNSLHSSVKKLVNNGLKKKFK